MKREKEILPAPGKPEAHSWQMHRWSLDGQTATEQQGS